jgi:myo-inositol-1(or 4)-monophosphatase
MATIVSVLGEQNFMNSPPGSDELRAYLEAAQEAARRAGQVLQQWRNRFAVREKGRFDLVTEADIASQTLIRNLLGGLFPDHAFIGEEDKGSQNRPSADAPPTWIVDPLDGTTNYVHDFPMYCVSIGLEVAGAMVVGVIYDPSREELFWAAHGQGAWLGERRLTTSGAESLERALLSTGFPPDLRGQETQLDCWRNFSLRAQSVRRTGSTALNLAYVAAGRFDGYWAFDNHVWDVAAGIVLIHEAGGKMTNIDGSTYDPYTPDALASNGPLHPAMLQILSARA